MFEYPTYIYNVHKKFWSEKNPHMIVEISQIFIFKRDNNQAHKANEKKFYLFITSLFKPNQ